MLLVGHRVLCQEDHDQDVLAGLGAPEAGGGARGAARRERFAPLTRMTSAAEAGAFRL